MQANKAGKMKRRERKNDVPFSFFLLISYSLIVLQHSVLCTKWAFIGLLSVLISHSMYLCVEDK